MGHQPLQIVAQSPPPNAQGVQSPKVSVLISAEPVPETYIMPNFVGRSLAEAVAQIEDAGFKVHRVHTAQPVSALPAPKDTPPATTVVIRQNPGAGHPVNVTTPTELEVSR
ncbi:MAG TPA: PASTA domain-containing protein [Terriglobales bacterium]|nr:PASTA domain-containing protein [Terriglobales bacterium]